MHGIYYVLSTLPIWATLMILLAVSMVPIQVMRNYFEGMQYQVAWSADFGGMAQALVMVIAIGILQRGPTNLLNDTFQVIAGIISLAIGAMWLKADWDTQWADRYHHIACFPLQLFLLVTLLPVIYRNGTTVEWIATICFFALFLFLFVIDIKQERLAQRPWLRKHMGVKFLNDDE